MRGPYEQSLVQQHRERVARMRQIREPTRPKPEIVKEPEPAAPTTAPDRVGLMFAAIFTVFGVIREDLIAPHRGIAITLPRQAAMYVGYKDLHLSTTRIGQIFGGRDHSTVIHAVKKIDRLYQAMDPVRERIDAVRAIVNGERLRIMEEQRNTLMGHEVNQIMRLARDLRPNDGDAQLSLIAHALVIGCIVTHVDRQRAVSLLEGLFDSCAKLEFVPHDA